MPQGFKRSRTLKRRIKRTPGGKLVIQYSKPNHKVVCCTKCGAQLPGMPRRNTLKTKISKSKRRPSRPYGGVLCSRCTRELIKGVNNA